MRNFGRSLVAALVGAGLVAAVPASADSNTQNGPPPTPAANGSQNTGPTTYTPVIPLNSGTSVGVTSTPNAGTPQTPPSSTYGVGIRIETR